MNPELYLYDLKTKFDKINFDEYYLSYSGGRDSHFLFWFIKNYLKDDRIPIIGCNTYMEFSEIRQRVYSNSDEVLYPVLKPNEIKEKYGIPCFTKDQDRWIYRYQDTLRKGRVPCKTVQLKINGTYPMPKFKGISKKAREYLLSGQAHKITHLCCYYLKKKPFHDYEKRTNRKAILGVRGSESLARKAVYKSCFHKNGKFTPIHDLTNELMDEIYLKYNIETPEIYQHLSRTGCVGCPYSRYGNGGCEKALSLASEGQRKFVISLFRESYDVLGIDYHNL